MFAYPQAKQCHADPGLVFKIVQSPRFVDKQALHFRLALCGRQTAQVNLLYPEWPAFVDPGHCPVFGALERRPQDLVAGDNRVQRLLHRADIEFAPQSHRLRLVVMRQLWRKLSDKPKPSLPGAEWIRGDAGAPRDRSPSCHLLDRSLEIWSSTADERLVRGLPTVLFG